MQESIDELIIKTICSVQPYLAHIYRTNRPKEQEQEICFEILGFDIIIDQNLKPWLLEVNHTPSFSADSDLDYKIKFNLIKDALKLINVKRKNSKLKKMDAINEYEDKNLGQFRRIHPIPNSTLLYQSYMHSAKEIWDLWSQGKKNSLKNYRNSKVETILDQKLNSAPKKRPFSALFKVQKISSQNNQIPIPKTIASFRNNPQIRSRPASAVNHQTFIREESKRDPEKQTYISDKAFPMNKNLKLVREFLKPKNVGIVQEINSHDIWRNNNDNKFITYKTISSTKEFDDKKLQSNLNKNNGGVFMKKITQYPSEFYLSCAKPQPKNSQQISLRKVSLSYLNMNKNLKTMKDKTFF